MRLHTNTLDMSDVHKALKTAKDNGTVAEHIHFEAFSQHGSRSHARAFEIQLGTYSKLPGDKRRYKNSGQYGASNIYAATYDEWGYFIKELFELDPELVFGNYRGLEDFNRQTKYAYAKD